MLFPMPGSPPRRMSEPGTIPPPKTRLSSLSLVSIRSSCVVSISWILSGLMVFLGSVWEGFQLFFSSFWITSSAMVFHSLQALHCPCHLAYGVPQFWQKKVVFIFDIYVWVMCILCLSKVRILIVLLVLLIEKREVVFGVVLWFFFDCCCFLGG